MDEQLLEDKLTEQKGSMKDSISYLEQELIKIRTGKASPAMLNGIEVDYYGSQTPLSQVANVGTSDSRTLTIKPWEKSMLGPIEQAIFAANLGLTPMNDGETVRISIPPLTEERRKDLAKLVRKEGEDAKVSIRSARQKAMDAIKKEVKNGYPEDAGKRKEEQVDGWTKGHINQVDDIVKSKEEEVMTI
ncbi:MAG: ribosome recycling factor [Bacteroidota bacterium]